MTSGTFTSYPIGGITILPNRQRKELRNIEELAESIQRLGLINPITSPQMRESVVARAEDRAAAKQLGGIQTDKKYRTLAQDMLMQDQ